MSDTTFRQKVEPAAESPQPEAKESTVGAMTEIEVPYTEYASQNSEPYTVKYFKLGQTWNDPQGGFPKELSAIEEFIQNKIETGEYPNNIEAVNNRLRAIEKQIGLPKDERAVIRVETVAAYVEFLMKADNIKYNIRRYGRTQ